MNRELFEKPLQKWRFKQALQHIKGRSVLDFGSHKDELKEFLPKDCKYIGCEKDYTIFKNKKFDCIVSLAVIEHIEMKKIKRTFRLLTKHLKSKGYFIVTTPTPHSRTILEIFAKFNLVDPKGIMEHKHYWNKEELYSLGKKNNLKVVLYKTFQLGLNQLVVYKK